MSQKPRRRTSKVVWATVVISAVAHLAIVVAILPPDFAEIPEPDDDKERFRVTRTEADDELEEAKPEEEDEPIELREEPEEVDEQKEEKPEEEEREDEPEQE
ncbi:MAG: hypothetical protein ACOCV2_15160, partial [Persicimonas sp.]